MPQKPKLELASCVIACRNKVDIDIASEILREEESLEGKAGPSLFMSLPLGASSPSFERRRWRRVSWPRPLEDSKAIYYLCWNLCTR